MLAIYQHQPEREQAVFRTVLGAVALLIYLICNAADLDEFSLVTLWMMGLYVMFGALTWLILRVQPGTSLRRLTVTTIVDQSMAITALALGDRAALPLLFIVFWFLVGTGCRYGKRPLIISCSIAVAGISSLMFFEPWWMLNYQVGLGIVLSVVATSFYLYVLVNKLERRAATDPLTGLLNRSSLLRAVGHAQAALRRYPGTSAVLLIDLDGFKEVNDSFGHAVGDSLLQRFADKLQNSGRRGDTLARMGGDEFVVFARKITGKGDAQAIADHIHSAIESIDLISGNAVSVSASIGVHVFSDGDPTIGMEPGRVIDLADRAMYMAKARGRRQTVYSDELC
ncbi:GGDEF domain-containing protein [Paraburkholderia caribensis]|uniref:GGDEF domain-containing protein n=1 Tax=Paraburkholderia TaxID=1822464 RepID=UPI001CC3A4AB|nr:GGDEF domain-containing protein [Paraburkholderia caribensis]BEU25568.1 GGDEF domain-containing protein [Paraburkholderia sp. 22B1P]